MNFLIDILKDIVLCFVACFVGQIIVYPIAKQLSRIADFFDSLEVSIDEREEDSEH